MSLLMDSEDDPDMEEDYKQMIQVSFFDCNVRVLILDLPRIFFQVNVVNFLKNVCQLEFTEKEIQKVCGILRTNALMVEDPYMKASLKDNRVGRKIIKLTVLVSDCRSRGKSGVSSIFVPFTFMHFQWKNKVDQIIATRLANF